MLLQVIRLLFLLYDCLKKKTVRIKEKEAGQF